MERQKLLGILLIAALIVSIVLIGGCTSDYSKGKVCGTHTEKYTSSVAGCDNMANCKCLHKTWGGVGSCDSCECTREVSNC